MQDMTRLQLYLEFFEMVEAKGTSKAHYGAYLRQDNEKLVFLILMLMAYSGLRRLVTEFPAMPVFDFLTQPNPANLITAVLTPDNVALLAEFVFPYLAVRFSSVAG